MLKRIFILAICLIQYQYQCFNCESNYFPYSYQQNNITMSRCVLNSCERGYCINNDLNQCTKTRIENCQQCLTAGSDNQTCLICDKGFYLQVNTCQRLLNIQQDELQIFVDSAAIPLTKVQGEQFERKLWQWDKPGTNISTALPSLLFAFKQLSIYSESYFGFSATIYLSKGDHYLAGCTNYDNQQFNLDPQMQGYYNLCEFIQKTYPSESGKLSIDKNDNYNITIQPLYCSLASDLGYSSNPQFMDICVDENQDDDYQPVINVMSSYAYFNVTGNLTVKDVKFTGVHALAKPEIVRTLPLNLCQITSQMDTTVNYNRQTVMGIEPVQDELGLKITWSCTDHLYSGSTTPFQNIDNNMRCQEPSNIAQSTLNCPGFPKHPNYFRRDIDDPSLTNGYPWRRMTLFNIFSFSSENTRKDQPQSPVLQIINCNFIHFYDGYESLIYVETDNLSKINKMEPLYQNETMPQTNITIISLAGLDLGMRLTMQDSNLQFSRFCRGLIYYRQFNPIISPEAYFIKQTSLVQQYPSTSNPFIYLNTNTFVMLNSLKNLTALQTMKIQTYQIQQGISLQIPKHHGIILNVDQFQGPIELQSNTITHNAHFIPEISFKYQPDIDLGIGLGISAVSKFIQKIREYQELRLGICQNNSDIRFFETVLTQAEDVEELYSLFEKASVIYISRPRHTVVFENNNFQQNIGIFGGAISIDSPDRKSPNFPAVVFLNNYFEHNMAYLSGNSIHAMLTKDSEPSYCGGIISDSNYHYQQAGTKIHNGGGATFVCSVLQPFISEQQVYNESPNDGNIIVSNSSVTIKRLGDQSDDDQPIVMQDLYSLVIDGDQYEDCNSGQRGAGVAVFNFTSVNIKNSIFTLNGPVYAPYIEFQYSPYYIHYSDQLINFNDNECKDEYDYLENCASNYLNTRPDILFSRTQGSLYVSFCNKYECRLQQSLSLIITDTLFNNNDSGSLLDRIFSDYNLKAASCIFIQGGQLIQLDRDTFSGNQGRFLSQYFTSMTPKLSSMAKDYFPPNYFFHSHSPVINWQIQLIQDLPDSNPNLLSEIYFTNCIFNLNKNIQTYNLPNFLSLQRYQGQLISVINDDESYLNIVAQMKVLNSSFTDNYFTGNQTSLIYAQNAILTLSGNSFVNNGQLMNTEPFGFFYQIQQHGILYLNNIDLRKPQSPILDFKFYNNKVSFLFVEQGVVTLCQRYHEAQFYNNIYSNIYSLSEGAILSIQADDKFMTTIFSNETYSDIYSWGQSLIKLNSNLDSIFTLIFVNCQFKNIKANTESPLSFGMNVRKVIISNSSFKFDNNFMDPLYFQLFYIRIKQPISYFTNTTFLKSIISEMSNKNGLIHVRAGRIFKAYIVKNFNGQSFTQVNDIDNNWATVIINGCNFTNLRPIFKNNAIILYESQLPDQLSLSNINILNVQVNKSALIGTGENSQIIGSNITFQQCSSAGKVSAIQAGPSSKLKLQNVKFLNNTSGLATIELMPDSTMQCIDCLFFGNFAQESTLFYNHQDSQLKIQNSQIISNGGTLSLMTFIKSTVWLKNVTFQNNKSQKLNTLVNIVGGESFYEQINMIGEASSLFISATMSAKVTLSNSVFSQLNGPYSSLLEMNGYSKGILSNVITINCSGSNIIRATNCQQLQVDKCTFNSNNALNEIIVERTPTIIKHTQFINGTGRYISAEMMSLEVINTTFQNGAQILGSGKGIFSNNQEMLTVNQSRFQNLSVSGNGGAISTSTSSALINQKHIINNNSFVNNSALKGSGDAVSTSTIIQGIPGTEISLSLEFIGISSENDAISNMGIFNFSQNFPIQLRKCIDGDQLTSDLQCQTCNSSQFLQNLTQNGTRTCALCLKNAQYLGGNLLIPAAGYFRAESYEFVQCPYKQACLGGDSENLSGKCAEGYKGQFCVECNSGYFQNGVFQCNKCPQYQKNLIKFILFFVILFSVIIILSFFTINTSTQIKPVLQCLLKIIVNHLHMIMIIGKINFNNGYEKLGKISDYLPSPQCLFNSKNVQKTSAYQQIMILNLIEFPAIALTALIFYSLYSCFKRQPYCFIYRYTAIVIIIGYLIIPNITLASLDSLNCMNVNGTLRLKSYGQSICFQGDHLNTVIRYTAPTLLLWTIATPLVLLTLIYRESQVRKLIEQSDINVKQYDDLIIFKEKFGFLISGYQSKYIFWECLIILRKFSLICTAIFLSNFSQEIQAIVMIIIITVSLIAHMLKLPYHTSFLNQLETSSFVVQLVLLYSGLIYLIGKNNEQQEEENIRIHHLFLSVIILSNIYFIIYWLYYFRLELSKLIILQIYKDYHKSGSIIRCIFTLIYCKTPKSQLNKYQKELRFENIYYKKVKEQNYRQENDDSSSPQNKKSTRNLMREGSILGENESEYSIIIKGNTNKFQQRHRQKATNIKQLNEELKEQKTQIKIRQIDQNQSSQINERDIKAQIEEESKEDAGLNSLNQSNSNLNNSFNSLALHNKNTYQYKKVANSSSSNEHQPQRSIQSSNTHSISKIKQQPNDSLTGQQTSVNEDTPQEDQRKIVRQKKIKVKKRSRDESRGRIEQEKSNKL